MLDGVVVVVREGGVEVYVSAGANASKSCCDRLWKGGVVVTLHTSPSQCNTKNGFYIAVRELLWHLQHTTRAWSKPPCLRMFAMPGRECRAMFEGQQCGCQCLGTLPSGTAWGPVVLKEIQKVAPNMLPVGGKGPVPFAPITRNMGPLVMLH